jgi:hypothetical protein
MKTLIFDYSKNPLTLTELDNIDKVCVESLKPCRCKENAYCDPCINRAHLDYLISYNAYALIAAARKGLENEKK